VYAIEYGKSLYPSDLVNTRVSAPYVRLSWMFYAILHNSSVILVDTGMASDRQAYKFRIDQFQTALDALRPLSISPDDVSDIVLTHSHIDHAGGIRSFPNARVHIQKNEIEYVLASVRYHDLENALRETDARGKLVIHDGDYLLDTIIHVKRTAGHTAGSQSVALDLPSGKTLITGDECYFIGSCVDGIPLPVDAAFSVENNRLFLGWVHSHPEMNLLTLHDPAIQSSFRSVWHGTVQVH